MSRPLDFDRTITEGAELWRDFERHLDTAERMVASAAGHPAPVVSYAVTAFAYVRAQQHELRKHLHEECGVEVDYASETSVQIRVVERDLARVKTLFEAMYRYYLLTELLTCDAAWWAMSNGLSRASAQWAAKNGHARWWADKYRATMPTLPPSYPAATALSVYVYVMRNYPILYGPLAQHGEGPPPARRLEEGAAGVLTAWVRSGIKMFPRLKAALAEYGDYQEVLVRELPGAVMAELSRLNTAHSDELAAFLSDLSKVKDEANRGVRKVLVNRVAHRLSAGADIEMRSDTDRSLSMTAPRTLYPTDPECRLTLFDLRCRDAERRLRRELAAWRGRARAEEMIDGRVVLVVRSGGATR